MNYVTSNWSYDPFLIVALVIVAWHEIGLRRLARRSRPERTRQRRLRSLWFYGGLTVLLVSVESPIDYWADDYFFVHMIQHLLLMFAAPTLIVAGAPWQPLLDALPARFRRSATRSALAGGWSRPLCAVREAVGGPWAAIIAFNVVMVAWHIPSLFDLAERNQDVHIWLMHGSFFAVGIWFWIQFIPSPPLHRRMPLLSRLGALVVTNVVMWFLAMSLSIFTQSSWYSGYSHVPGVTLPPFADQQIGAAILWVCGDLWCFPAVAFIILRLAADDGGVGAAIEKILGRGSARIGWAKR
ncbi:MAG TPA: cytochrome c oxidase assembly protein [Streptosporangiaceae bacterium]|nr:cytochrome c oxidase assembly protein [Streptosporangiaceae bacterium]